MQNLERLVAEFESNPILVRRSINDAWGANPETFFVKAVEILCKPSQSVGQKFLISFLIQNANLTERLANPEAMTREESVSLARLGMRVDPSLDIKMAMALATAATSQPASALRLLEVLESVGECGNLLPILSQALRHADGKVRSKAALLMGKGNQNAGWVRRQLLEPDCRVRANAVESMWGAAGDDARAVFQSAAQDANQRVVINAVLGLYLAGATQSVELFHELATHPDPLFRSSAAWALGRTQDPRFLRQLTSLVRDTDPKVRAHALRSTVRVRNYRTLVEDCTPIRVRILSGCITPSGKRTLQIAVRQACNPNFPILPALSFVAEEDDSPVLRYEVKPARSANNSIGIVLPARGELDESTQLALESALNRALTAKAPSEQWAIALQTHRNVSAESGRNAVYQESPAKIVKEWESAAASPFCVFLSAIASLLPVTSVAKPRRALIVCASAIPETTSIVLYRQHQMAKFLQNLAGSGTPVHAIAPAGCPPLLHLAMQEMCDATSGRLYDATTPEDAGDILENLLLAAYPSYTMDYWGFPAHSADAEPQKHSVRVLVHCAFGLGECTTDIGTGKTSS